MFVHGKLFQLSIIFASKARAYLSGVSFRHSTLGWAPGFFCKHLTRPERPERDKHSSLLQTFVNDGRKKFYKIGPRGLYHKKSRVNNLQKINRFCSKLVSFLLPVTYTSLDQRNLTEREGSTQLT